MKNNPLLIFIGIAILFGGYLYMQKGAETAEVPSLDFSTFFAQVCASKEGPCEVMLCEQEGEAHVCAKNVADFTKNCSNTKQLDDIITAYKVCGMSTAQASNGMSIYNYSEKNNPLFTEYTPAQLDKKIEEEVAKVESGGTSSFLSTMMAVTAGSIVGGMITSALFGNRNAMMPNAKAPQANSTPLNQKSLNDVKNKEKAGRTGANGFNSKKSQTKSATKNNVRKAKSKAGKRSAKSGSTRSRSGK